MNKENLTDYMQWKKVNDDSFSLFNYLHGVQSTGDLKPDYIVALLEILWPSFIEKDGYILVEEEFRGIKLEQFQDGSLNEDEVEYWTNLINIDGLFPNLETKSYSTFLDVLKNSWKAKLLNDFPTKNFEVKCFIEDDGEFFITFYQTEIDDE